MLKTTTLGYYSTVFDVLFCIAYHLENKHIIIMLVTQGVIFSFRFFLNKKCLELQEL